jgi:hypothetical protein
MSSIENFKYRNRIVRIEPSPFIKPSTKIKMSQNKVNSAGQALVDVDGNIKKTDIDVDHAIQVPGTSKIFSAALTPSGLKTGLNILVENPYAEEPVYHPSWGEMVLKGKEKASLQNILEYKHRRAFDFYTGNLFDRVDPSTKVSELPFYLTPQSKVSLDGGVKLLDLSNPIHEVNYYMLRVHGEIANSYSELQEGRNQTALYYFSDASDSDDRKTVRIRMETRASSIINELSQTPEIIIAFAKALECEDRALNASKAFKYVYEFFHTMDGLDIDPAKYSIFMKYHEIFEDINRRPRFFAASILQDALNHSIIRYRDDKYYWIKPETEDAPLKTFEWVGKEKVVDFLIGPEYEDEVKLLESLIASKSSITNY